MTDGYAVFMTPDVRACPKVPGFEMFIHIIFSVPQPAIQFPARHEPVVKWRRAAGRHPPFSEGQCWVM